MEFVKNKIKQEPEKANRAVFLELAKKDERGVPRSTGKHFVKLLRGEEGNHKDYKTQKDEQGLWLFFDENGTEKKYFVPIYVNDKNSANYGKFHYLFERFAEIEENEDLVIEYVKKGMGGYVDVRKASEDSGEIPVIEDEIPIEEYENR